MSIGHRGPARPPNLPPGGTEGLQAPQEDEDCLERRRLERRGEWLDVARGGARGAVPTIAISSLGRRQTRGARIGGALGLLPPRRSDDPDERYDRLSRWL